MTTIEDIAKEAGVSVATVSRVLNGRGYVAEATRDAVLKAAKKLGRSVSPDIERKRVLVAYVPSGQRLVEPFMVAADDFNFSLLYKVVPHLSLTAENIAFDGNFDGALLIDSVIDRTEMAKLQARMPIVECRNYNDIEREVSVMVDDVAMGYRLTRHLIMTGKTRIATIHLDDVSSRPHVVERMHGYLAALAEAGLTPAKTYHRTVLGSKNSALLASLRSDAGKEWDALIYPEPIDELVDLYHLLQEDGHEIPNGIAIASFGDSPNLENAEITAMRQPLESIARASLFILDSLMSGRLTVNESIQLRLQPMLSIRCSTQVR